MFSNFSCMLKSLPCSDYSEITIPSGRLFYHHLGTHHHTNSLYVLYMSSLPLSLSPPYLPLLPMTGLK